MDHSANISQVRYPFKLACYVAIETRELTNNTTHSRRFQTQFYVAFLDETRSAGFSSGDKQERLPTHDGGQEVVEARFVHPTKALKEFYTERITLFPPQFYLLTTLSDILVGGQNTREQRDRIRVLSNGAFGRMAINPRPIHDKEADAEGFRVIAYEGDEANGGLPGRRHRCRLKFGQGGVSCSAEVVVLSCC